MRVSTVMRKTRETDISLTLALDGIGITKLNTGIGFFDHMLDAMARFGFLNLSVSCNGDLKPVGAHPVLRKHFSIVK